jgi:cytidylate kinase
VLTVPVLSVAVVDGAVGGSSSPHPLIVMVTPANIAKALWMVKSRLVKEFSWLIATSWGRCSKIKERATECRRNSLERHDARSRREVNAYKNYVQ